MATEKRPAVDPWADWTPPVTPTAPSHPKPVEPHTVELGDDDDMFALGNNRRMAERIDPGVVFETYPVGTVTAWRAVFTKPEAAAQYRAEWARLFGVRATPPPSPYWLRPIEIYPAGGRRE